MNDPTATHSHIVHLAQEARMASRLLATLSSEQKNKCLRNLAAALEANPASLLQANAKDLAGLGCMAWRTLLMNNQMEWLVPMKIMRGTAPK